MSEIFTILVRLLDEAVNVWRPVRAEKLGFNRFRILDQPYDREVERWQFEPNAVVVAEIENSSDGLCLRAKRLSGRPNARYEHVFVVVRLRSTEADGEGEALNENDVMLTKAFFELEDAEREVQRLNELNKGHWHYFSCVARLADDASRES